MQVKTVNHLLVDTNENVMMVDRARKDSLGEWENLDIDRIVVGANTIRLFFNIF